MDWGAALRFEEEELSVHTAEATSLAAADLPLILPDPKLETAPDPVPETGPPAEVQEDEVIVGTAGNDVLDGGAGNDTVAGAGEHDLVRGDRATTA